MRTKKQIIRITIVLVIVSLLLLTVAQFWTYNCADVFEDNLNRYNANLVREYIILISGGVFSSSLVTFLITLREYKDIKTSTLDEYYDVCVELLYNYRNLKYLYLNHPIDIIKACLREEADNENKRKLNISIEDIISKSGDKINDSIIGKVTEEYSYENKEKMKGVIWDNTDEIIKKRLLDDKLKEEYLEDEYKFVMKNYYTQLDQIMKQYIQISKCSCAKMENAFGKIDFIFANKSKRREFIYQNLHIRQRNELNKIKNIAWDFEEFYNSESDNLPVVMSKILELQEDIFVRKDSRIGTTIYNQYCFEINTQLNELLKLAYGKRYKDVKPNIHDYKVFSVCRLENKNVQED